MRNRIFLLTVLFIACATTSFAAGRSEFSLAPSGGYHWGHTSYKFELLGVIEGNGFPSGTGIGSELIFPLDFPTVGATAEYRYIRDELPIWTVTAHFSKGVSDPGDVFTDRDWYAIPNGLIWNFSWTESEVDGSFTEFGVEGTRLIAARDFWELSLLVGFDYQKISQEALGFAGAQYDVEDVSPTMDFYVFSDPRLALTYEISYFRPQIGLAPTLIFGDGVRLKLKAAATPLLRINDTDNHLLRFFRTEADGRGMGYFSSASLRFDFGPASTKQRPFLALDGEYARLEADLGAVSTWYDDDPIDDEDNTGWRIIGIPHSIRSSQYSLCLRFGYTF